MAITTSEIRVSFRGDGAGAGELTWGQLRVWRTTRSSGRTLNLVPVTTPQAAASVEKLASALRFVVSRNPVLRTRLRLVEGRSAPLQVVAESGEIPLHILDIDDGDDAEAVAEDVRARYERTWFDYEREFPVRMAVVRQSATLTHLIVCYSHVMIDGAALAALTRDIEGHSDGASGTTSSSLTPLELARAEGSPAGRRESARSLRYWEKQIERLATHGGGAPVEPQEPRFWELMLYSPAMELSLRAIAADRQVRTPFVLLAAYAVAVARVLGRNPVVALPVVGNRFRPGLADSVCQLSQPGIAVIDVADTTFDQVVDRAWKAAMGALLCGYYDPVAGERLFAEIAARRGEPLDIWWNYNDRRGLFSTDDEQYSNSQGELRAAMRDALPHTELWWDRKVHEADGVLFVEADSYALRTLPAQLDQKIRDAQLPAMYLRICCDTHRFTPDQIQAFAREMETIAVAAAFDPALPTGIRRSPITV